jgi:hypothetical protein
LIEGLMNGLINGLVSSNLLSGATKPPLGTFSTKRPPPKERAYVIVFQNSLGTRSRAAALPLDDNRLRNHSALGGGVVPQQRFCELRR